ncbi:MAG: DHHA1 domain-containing protein, partial [Mariprofundaceae bacterium]|nr:DHHA1 domain-containing protein [Mariprofundaceae bacterium]
YHKDWHAGVVGLAAGRLARQHHRPAAVGFVDDSGAIRVSLRGVSGFHIGDLLHACSDCLLGFGGHAGAGGGTIREGRWGDFVSAMGKAIQQQCKGESKGREYAIDGVLTLPCLHIGLAHRIRQFEPIGRKNPAISWLIQDVHVSERKDLKGGVIRLTLSDGQYYLPAIVFFGSVLSPSLQLGSIVSVLGQLKPDDWKGYDAIQFEVEDVWVNQDN